MHKKFGMISLILFSKVGLILTLFELKNILLNKVF